jgi:hypothetical protein
MKNKDLKHRTYVYTFPDEKTRAQRMARKERLTYSEWVRKLIISALTSK